MAFLRYYFLLLLAVGFGIVVGQNQQAILYAEFNQEGNNISFPCTYSTDLAKENFDNKTHSACVTGVWLFYEDPDFNPVGGRRVEYVLGWDNYCVNLKVVSGSVSSVRYAGHPQDYTIESFTIYEYDYFQGREEYAFNELEILDDDLRGKHQSIIITGRCNWTVYDQQNFQGNSICLTVPQDAEKNTPSFITDLQKDAGSVIPYGSIKSVRKGCESTNNSRSVKLASFGNFMSLFHPRALELQ